MPAQPHGKPQYGSKSSQHHCQGISQARRNYSPYQAADGGPALVDNQVGTQRPRTQVGEASCAATLKEDTSIIQAIPPIVAIKQSRGRLRRYPSAIITRASTTVEI